MASPSERPVEPAQPIDDFAEGIDLDALLVALVLVPQSYPRNRFYALYRRPEAYETRRRAALLRSLIADLAGEAEAVELARSAGETILSYELREMGARRTTRLSEHELAIVKLAVERLSCSAALRRCLTQVDDDAVARVTPLLERLFAR